MSVNLTPGTYSFHVGGTCGGVTLGIPPAGGSPLVWNITVHATTDRGPVKELSRVGGGGTFNYTLETGHLSFGSGQQHWTLDSGDTVNFTGSIVDVGGGAFDTAFDLGLGPGGGRLNFVGTGTTTSASGTCVEMYEHTDQQGRAAISIGAGYTLTHTGNYRVFVGGSAVVNGTVHASSILNCAVTGSGTVYLDQNLQTASSGFHQTISAATPTQSGDKTSQTIDGVTLQIDYATALKATTASSIIYPVNLFTITAGTLIVNAALTFTTTIAAAIYTIGGGTGTTLVNVNTNQTLTSNVRLNGTMIVTVANNKTLTINSSSSVGTGVTWAGAGTVLVNGTQVWPNPVPSVPTLSLPAANATGVKRGSVSWAAVAGATSYKVYHDTTNGSTYVGTTTGTSFSVTRAVSTTYYWTVVASNAAGDSAAATVQSYTTKASFNDVWADGVWASNVWASNVWAIDNAPGT